MVLGFIRIRISRDKDAYFLCWIYFASVLIWDGRWVRWLTNKSEIFFLPFVNFSEYLSFKTSKYSQKFKFVLIGWRDRMGWTWWWPSMGQFAQEERTTSPNPTAQRHILIWHIIIAVDKMCFPSQTITYIVFNFSCLKIFDTN